MAAAQYFEQVQKIFIAFYQRPADPAGLKYWAERVDAAGGNINEVINAFASSAEATALYGAVNATTIGAVVDSLYMALFNVAPDAAGKAFYVNGFAAGTFTAGTIALAVLNGAQKDDRIAINNKVQVANEFTHQVDGRALTDAYFGSGASFNVTYSGDADAVAARGILKAVTFSPSTVISPSAVTEALKAQIANPGDVIIGQTGGQTFTLTTGIDNLTGTAGNDTFVGVADATTATLNTLSAGDSVNGGAGIDTLKVIVANTVGANTPLAGVTLSNIEKITVQNVAVGASTINMQPIAGVTTVGSLNSTGTVTFQNLAAGTNVAVGGSAQTGAVNFNQLNASDAVNVTVDGGVNGVTVAATAGTATTATINSTGAANGNVAVGNDTFVLSGGTNTVTKLNVNAATNLRATLTVSDFATAGADLVVAGAASSVNLGNAGVFKTIDASGLTAGGVNVALNAVTTSFKGGAGNDSVTGAAVVTASASIDGGAGIDTVAATLVNAGNSAAFKNFELIDLAGATGTLDAALLTNSTITGVAYTGALGGAFVLSNLVETAAGFNVDVTGSAGSASTLGFTAASVAGTADVLNYNFAAANAASATVINANTITSAGIENINISSKGGLNITNALTVVDNTAKSIVITGDHALSLGITQAAASATASSALTSIDGSAATAALTITVGAVTTGLQSAYTIKGGSANDVITVATTAGATSVGATVTTGAGNDNVNVTAATAQVATAAFQFTTITDFQKGDSLTFVNHGTEVFNAAAVNVSTAVTLEAAVNLASLGDGATANSIISWFVYGGNTYVVEDNSAGITFTAADNIVKLTGILDLSASTGAGTNVITFA
ncbi:hypothetical protein [Simplicispira psychrophila]|uniref:hypothetical protein n=1 Tax=Simplicispira psychrophila TaxID=80882 RepID=UPI0004899C28|nr:hypothetical protein [Simplicispira psychrophila]